MNKNDVIAVFKMLARSQGLYGRLLNAIAEAEAVGKDLTEYFDQFKSCKDAVDVVLMVES